MAALADTPLAVAALVEVAVAALLAGIGVTAVFSVAILASSRLAEQRRAGHRTAATAWGVVAGVSLLMVAAGVAYGLQVMTSK